MAQTQPAVSQQQPQPAHQPLTVPLSTSFSSSSSSASPRSVVEASASCAVQ